MCEGFKAQKKEILPLFTRFVSIVQFWGGGCSANSLSCQELMRRFMQLSCLFATWRTCWLA